MQLMLAINLYAVKYSATVYTQFTDLSILK